MSNFLSLLGFLVACSLLNLAAAQIFKEACLNAHNHYRRLHGAPDLVLDDELQNIALRWAQYCAKYPMIANSGRDGETVHYAHNVDGKFMTGWNITEKWYGYGVRDRYDWNNPPGSNPGIVYKKIFAQLLWKNTKRLGCGFAQAKGSRDQIIVAVYDPPGNIEGEYVENVLPLLN